jgi:hypothetical protein
MPRSANNHARRNPAREKGCSASKGKASKAKREAVELTFQVLDPINFVISVATSG